jgi:hypothetical protein
MDDESKNNKSTKGCLSKTTAIITAIAGLIAAIASLIVAIPKPPTDIIPKPPVKPPSSPPSTGCFLTINASNIPLMREPDYNSQQLATVIPGRYNSLNYTSRPFYGFGKEGWHKIESEGQVGWIQDNNWTINGKSGNCS